MSIESRLSELNLQLPPAPPKGGVYQPVLLQGNLAYFSGHGPYKADGTYITGKVGADIDLAAGQEAARQTGLAILASMRERLGSLDRIKRVIKLLGMVDCPPDFKEHPKSSTAAANCIATSSAKTPALASAAPSAWAPCPAASRSRSRACSRFQKIIHFNLQPLHSYHV